MGEPADAADATLVALARAAMARAGMPGAAAVRDLDGRTYVGVPVRLAALELTGLQVAVAAAISSGATGFEAAVLLDGAPGDPGPDAGIAAVRELSPGARITVAGPDGQPR